MNIEEKINDLDIRLQKLEKIEKRRKTMSIINLCVKLIIIIAMAIVFYKIYSTLIKYKDILDQTQDISTKLSTTEEFLQEQLDKFNFLNK